MKPLIRFGRRIPIPSTLQIRNELRTFSVEKFMAEMAGESARPREVVSSVGASADSELTPVLRVRIT